MNWTEIIATAVGTIMVALVPLLVQLIRAYTARIKVAADADSQTTLEKVKNQAAVLALTLAENLAEKELPKLAAKVRAGTITSSEAVKAELHSLGVVALQDLKTALPTAAETLGDDALKALIRYAADKVSPFQGKETAVEMLQGGAEKLLAYGVTALRKSTAEVKVD